MSFLTTVSPLILSLFIGGTLLAFFLGACVGSFINVYVYRNKEHISGTYSGRSFCPKCKSTLQWYDLIPVISYTILLRGKCRYCRTKIAKQYLFVELIIGLVFLLLFFNFQNAIFNLLFIQLSLSGLVNGLLYLIFITTLLLLALYDLRYFEIPVMPTLFLILVGLLILPFEGSLTATLYIHSISLLIALLFFGSQVFLSRERWMGRGDLYIGIALALILNWPQFLLMIVSSYCIGAIFGIYILFFLKKRNSHLPLVPLLAAGTLFVLMYGQSFISWYAGLIGY